VNIRFNEPVQGHDLNELLSDNDGTFVAEHHGQQYIVVCRRDRSITFGPKPIGRARVDLVSAITSTPQPWTVTKLSNGDLSEELRTEERRERPELARRTA
jgi:hypothetical protein